MPSTTMSTLGFELPASHLSAYYQRYQLQTPSSIMGGEADRSYERKYSYESRGRSRVTSPSAMGPDSESSYSRRGTPRKSPAPSAYSGSTYSGEGYCSDSDSRARSTFSGSTYARSTSATSSSLNTRRGYVEGMPPPDYFSPRNIEARQAARKNGPPPAATSFYSSQGRRSSYSGSDSPRNKQLMPYGANAAENEYDVMPDDSISQASSSPSRRSVRSTRSTRSERRHDARSVNSRAGPIYDIAEYGPPEAGGGYGPDEQPYIDEVNGCWVVDRKPWRRD